MSPSDAAAWKARFEAAAIQARELGHQFFTGPGTQLKKLLAKVGITASPTCSCNARARTMDANGCDWCEANVDQIVGWLREEAAKRELPFLDAVGKVLVRRAIKLARKDAARGTQAKNDGDGPPAV